MRDTSDCEHNVHLIMAIIFYEETLLVENKIFISHSRRDASLRDYMLKIFGLTNMGATVIEYENFERPPWKQIKNAIKSSKAVFLLIGDNVVDSGIYTQNWISFEVGISCQLGRQVWVFEEYNKNIQFPVPYLTYYYPMWMDDYNIHHIKKIINLYEVKNKLGERIYPTNTIVCPHYNCGIQFKMVFNEWEGVIQCPACRQEIDLFYQYKVHEQEGIQ